MSIHLHIPIQRPPVASCCQCLQAEAEGMATSVWDKGATSLRAPSDASPARTSALHCTLSARQTGAEAFSCVPVLLLTDPAPSPPPSAGTVPRPSGYLAPRGDARQEKTWLRQALSSVSSQGRLRQPGERRAVWNLFLHCKSGNSSPWKCHAHQNAPGLRKEQKHCFKKKISGKKSKLQAHLQMHLCIRESVFSSSENLNYKAIPI